MVEPQCADDWVKGEVYELKRPQETFALLDEYEGCSPSDVPPLEFERTLAEVTLDSGTMLNAWVYMYRLDRTEEQRIVSGDYFDRVLDKPGHAAEGHSRSY
jgi:gamma-glutamylcyclotransferase (GGCT)/AIG2-like uncharacterized protein YtfP